MSYIGAFSKMLFGADGTQNARASGGSNHQLIPESIVTTTSRITKGPQRFGQWSAQLIVGAGTVPVGNLTVWYSNLPAPDPDVDGHWSQILTIAAVDLSVPGTPFLDISNTFPEWIRFKVTRTSGTINLVLWARANGVEV